MDYKLFVQGEGEGEPFLAPEGARATPEGRVLSPEGEDLGEARFVKDIPPIPKEELRDLVFRIVDGQVLTLDQVPADLVGMVFMPVMFGALAPPNMLAALPDAPALPPGPPVPTEAPDEPLPPEPPEPKYHPLLAEVVKDYEWGLVDREEVAVAKAKVEESDRPLREAHAQAVKAWRRTCQQVRRRNAAKHRSFMAAHEAYLTLCEAWQAECARLNGEYEAHCEAHKALRERVFSLWLKDLGTVVGDMKDAPTGRAINGLPIFVACRLVRTEEWARVRAAVQREWDRRRKDDPFGEEAP
jgi:hypothetical protein